MKTNIKWTEGMKFVGNSDGNETMMDAKSPIGKGEALTPKELVALGLSGCTAMDVVALLKKYKQTVDTFEVSSEITTSEKQQPVVFTKAELVFKLTGSIDKEKLIEAVHLSQTKFCGVSAMLAKAFPISYRVELNGNEIVRGEAKF